MYSVCMYVLFNKACVVVEIVFYNDITFDRVGLPVLCSHWMGFVFFLHYHFPTTFVYIYIKNMCMMHDIGLESVSAPIQYIYTFVSRNR